MKSYQQITLALALLLTGLAGVHAQETSSGIRGVVLGTDGQPLAGANVTVRNDGKGLTRSTRTNASGEYRFANLPIGDGYTLSAGGGGGYAPQKLEGLALNLGKTADVDFTLTAGDAMEEVLVLGQAESLAQIALGPSVTFGQEALENLPAINRNINDVLRADPRLYIDESRGGVNEVQCAGKNSRFNSLTVDGVRLNDAFGLNSNGYPTERIPFSYDAINQVAVELAPFDVQYGGFSACNINAVTKSGGNEFHGSAFFDYTNDGLRASSLEGDAIRTGKYNEKRYGAAFGGPIVKDTLFFFAAYEKLEGANLFDRGPIGSGAVNEVAVTQAELDEIVEIANTVYQYDPGTIPSSLDHDDEKILLKLDWNINDAQRMNFTYTYNNGFNFTESDSDQNEFEFSNHLYERGAKLNSWVGSVYSDWTDDFSTEVRIGYARLDNRQLSVGGTDFGEIRVELEDVDVYLGGDDSRQSNKLDYDLLNLAFKGKYYLNGHNISFGYERESLEIFNLFVQHTETEIRFDGIDNFRNGLADAIYYNNAPSNNPQDAAADWGYAINTIYVQDEFSPIDRLTLIAGLRYDWYTTGDAPAENADFLADYGFSNNATLDGESLLQPRLGFTFDYSDATTLHGGLGRYSGGNPNVWLSNTYSSNNVMQFGQRGRSFGYTNDSRRLAAINLTQQRSLFDDDVVYVGCEEGVPEGPGYCIPQELFNAVAGGTGDNFEINYLDPDFAIPHEWKFALGLVHVFPQAYIFSADILYTLSKDSAIVQRGDLERTGANAEGYPTYDSVRESSFVLTNSDETAQSLSFALGLSKRYDNGLDFTLGYAYTDSEDINPMTSSVAFSNYQNRAFFDPQEDIASTSNYNIEHRITATANYFREFFDGLVGMNIGLYAALNSGQPYSYTVAGNPIYNFTPFLEGENVLRPGVARNAENGPWWEKVDLRISADFRGFTKDSRASAFMVIDNLTNLLNGNWGVLKEHNFPQTVVEGTELPRIGDASRYEIRFGVKYSF